MLRSQLNSGGAAVQVGETPSIGFLHGLRLVCSDVPDFEASVPVAAQVWLAVGGTAPSSTWGTRIAPCGLAMGR